MAKFNVVYTLKAQIEAETIEEANETAQSNLEGAEFGDYSVDESTVAVTPPGDDVDAAQKAAA